MTSIMKESVPECNAKRLEYEGTDSSTKRSCPSFLKNNLLILLIMLGVGFGFAVGFAGREANPSDEATIWIGLPGELYMRMLKMTILPLVVSTVITGTASLNPKENGRLGALSIAFIVLTNGFGALLAVALFFMFKPGDEIQTTSQSDITAKSTHLQTNDMFVDMIRNLFPDNIVTACFQKTQTHYVEKSITVEVNSTNITTSDFKRSKGETGGINILGIIIICTAFGIATSKVGESGRPFINLFKAISDIILTVLRWFIWSTPVGVASLIAASLLKVSDIGGAFESLGLYIVCFSTGTLVHLVVLVPLMYVLVMRRNPLPFMFSAMRPMMTSFGPASAAVAMPEMLNALENANGVDSRISRFVIPVETALAKFGSSAFICLSALFLTKVEMSSIAVTEVILIFILSTVGSLAIPTIPSSSIITVMVILSSLNVPTQSIGLLMTVEWFTDRFRTSTNVLSMLLGGILIDQACRKHLDKGEETGNYVEIDIKEEVVHVLENGKCVFENDKL